MSVLLKARQLTVLFACLLAGVALVAGQAPPAPLDAKASDPVTLGWMVGHPPPPDKLISFADGSFFRFPQTRWSFSHYRELVPTRAVSRGHGPVLPLPRSERSDLEGIT